MQEVLLETVAEAHVLRARAGGFMWEAAESNPPHKGIQILSVPKALTILTEGLCAAGNPHKERPLLTRCHCCREYWVFSFQHI